MIITHRIPWEHCLSHEIFPAIEDGWQDDDRPIHFFWGLGSKNIPEIRECIEKGEEWWYIDVGYLTEQITRYPTPKIHDYDKTYFRICKGSIHSNKMTATPGHRWSKLQKQGIDCEFRGWTSGEKKYVLVCPSSPTVTHHINGISQEEWIEQVTQGLKQYTDLPVKVRNKPRPGNEWWGTDIKDDLPDAKCLVTNMSLSAVEGILHMVPAITHGMNVASPVSSRDLKFVNKPFRPGRKTVQSWLHCLAENQFTIEEIQNGTAYRTLWVQYEN